MKILIIKTSSLGDIIHAFPALQFLRSMYPHAQIDWVVEKPFAELVQAHPDVNEVISVQTKKWRSSFWKKESRQEITLLKKRLRWHVYDMVFDLQGNIKSSLFTGMVKSPLKVGFGRQSVPEWPNLLFTNRRYNPPLSQNIREDYLFLVQSTLQKFTKEMKGIRLRLSEKENHLVEKLVQSPSLQKGLKVMVCPGSHWTNKQMTMDSLKGFLDLIHQNLQGRFLFVWGSEKEKQMAEELVERFSQNSMLSDRLPLPVLQNVMAQMDVVVAMDSLPLHLAGTTPVPSFGIFGASSAYKYKPLGLQHHAFQGRCPYQKTFEKRCPILRSCKTGSCIKDIDVLGLYEDFLSWWTTLNLVFK